MADPTTNRWKYVGDWAGHELRPSRGRSGRYVLAQWSKIQGSWTGGRWSLTWDEVCQYGDLSHVRTAREAVELLVRACQDGQIGRCLRRPQQVR